MAWPDTYLSLPVLHGVSKRYEVEEGEQMGWPKGSTGWLAVSTLGVSAAQGDPVIFHSQDHFGPHVQV